MEFFLLINKYLLFINKFTYICSITFLTLIMKAKLDFYLIIIHIVCWIVFIGLAIETGGYVTNAFVTLFINPEWATHFWGNLDLSGLFQYDLGLFICLIVIIITLSTLKTILFYNTISLFHKKKFNLDHPFNEAKYDMVVQSLESAKDVLLVRPTIEKYFKVIVDCHSVSSELLNSTLELINKEQLMLKELGLKHVGILGIVQVLREKLEKNKIDLKLYEYAIARLRILKLISTHNSNRQTLVSVMLLAS